MTNPVRRVSTEQIHEGRLVRLSLDSVVLPRGTETIFERVEIKNGASAIAMEENGDVWLVREWKYAVDRPSLEVVSGGIEPGEEPIDTARRELREEAGLTAAKWTSMSFVDPFTTMLRCPNHLFLAQELTPVPREPEEGEVMEVRRVPLEEAVRLVMEGGITHGTSCVAILKAAELVRTHSAVLGNATNR
jgi:ADP-ribose pyrophosphatase